MKIFRPPLFFALALGMLLMGVGAVRAVQQPSAMLGASAWALWCSWIAYAILATGRWHPYRLWLFAVLAVGTLLALPWGSISTVVEWSARARTGLQSDSPVCHIALAGTVGNLATQTARAMASPDFMGWGFYYFTAIFYLLFTLLLGTGWCGWACGFGAWDEMVSRLGGRRPRWLLPGSPGSWLVMSGALLLTVVLLSLVRREAFFCQWLCPFKLQEAFGAPGHGQHWLHWGMVLAVGLVFILVLPAATGKRTFCLLICPFGAWQRWAGRLTPFQLVCDLSKCQACGRCGQICPLGAIETGPGPRLKYYSQCVLCGRCLEACPTRALGIGWKIAARVPAGGQAIFLYTALTMTGLVGLVAWMRAGAVIWHLFHPTSPL